MRESLGRLACWLACIVGVLTMNTRPICAQVTPGFSTNTGTQSQANPSIQIAQAPPGGQAATPNILPTDLTPQLFAPQRGLLSRETQFKILKRLPERLWFNGSAEVSNRLETNVFQKSRNAHADYSFRVSPNVSLGWNVLSHTSVYTNYFLIKDLFVEHPILNFPTVQSVSWGLRQDVPINPKTSGTLDFQARELWAGKHNNHFDFLPTMSLTRVVAPQFIVFGSALLQIHGNKYMWGPTKELDPFFSLGFLYRYRNWNFTASDSFVWNIRKPHFHQATPGNESMICDFELSHAIPWRIPGLVGFVRAEPVWNFDSHRTPGLSGTDFRLFGGIRIAFAKPSYTSSIEQLRKQLMETETEETTPPKAKPTHEQPPSSRKDELSPVSHNEMGTKYRSATIVYDP